MARKGRARFCVLIQRVQELHPDVDAREAIEAGRVLVDGRIVTNSLSLVPYGASIRLADDRLRLRGETKLQAALAHFAVAVTGKVALDLGASAGGFTTALIAAGAKRVYAVDVGYGQLLGSLRQHPRVINLERTNLSDLNRHLVPDMIEVITVDLSYLALTDALPQLRDRVIIGETVDLVALVKPMFELRLPTPPCHPDALRDACRRAAEAATAAGWSVEGVIESPISGRHGAREFLLHGRR
jgi:23S rRNA (cytidine1920-2'-O)/16S rRNA (cytidine1409-2'-O)-methyltransferase